MPTAPPTLCSRPGCGGKRRAGVCDRCGPARRHSTWTSDPRYRTRRWKKRAAQQLAYEPLCRLCNDQGLVTAATVADHIEPHRGDETAFWYGELQSLCASCHGAKSARERRTQSA